MYQVQKRDCKAVRGLIDPETGEFEPHDAGNKIRVIAEIDGPLGKLHLIGTFSTDILALPTKRMWMQVLSDMDSAARDKVAEREGA